MEIDHLKSSTSTHEEDQMEMMMLMDKLPSDFFSTYNDIVTHDLSSSLEFPPPGATTASNMSTDSPVQDFIHSTQNISPSPSLMSFPSTVPYVNNNTPIQEDCSRSFPSNPAGMARWRGVEFPGASAGGYCNPAQKNKDSMAAMREMIFRIAAMQPIHIDPESVKPPKRRNVKISKDPQSVAARHRRERISERIRILQRLVPGGTKMDTASMLDEAIHYVKFLKTQVQSLERAQANKPSPSSSSSSSTSTGIGFPVAMSSGSNFPIGKPYQQQHNQNVQHYGA